jgi:hypothetical protein
VTAAVLDTAQRHGKSPAVRSSPTIVLFLALVAGPACNSHEKEGNELALLIQKVQGYTDADEAEQGPQLDALRRFAPSTERVGAARTACLDAYTLVERAESDHAEARRMLDGLTGAAGDLAATRPKIEKRIASSNKAIEDARPLIARCTRLLSDLKREHRR